jgi:hypothetical protein
MRRSIVPAIGVAAGLGALAAIARRVLDRPDPFYAWSGASESVQTANGSSFGLPITYHRTEQVVSIHPAALEAVRALLPTDDLHPVRLPDGRTLVALSAARYRGESGMGARAVREMIGARHAGKSPPVLPLAQSMLPCRGAPSFSEFLLPQRRPAAQRGASGEAGHVTNLRSGRPADGGAIGEARYLTRLPGESR